EDFRRALRHYAGLIVERISQNRRQGRVLRHLYCCGHLSCFRSLLLSMVSSDRAAPEKRDGPCEDRGSARIYSLSAIVSDCRPDPGPKYLAEHDGPDSRRGILGC